eukprot:TRINITY_DN13523_c0_g1_i1.p1 TRINITY_DN13523_c0_g1~~TRINITY_DN13523_c0_g1_i1.p1  ORF type:complete len:167 (+),score=24.86 TRINITY_DN13523_c0_g1_i1:201-701(+)
MAFGQVAMNLGTLVLFGILLGCAAFVSAGTTLPFIFKHRRGSADFFSNPLEPLAASLASSDDSATLSTQNNINLVFPDGTIAFCPPPVKVGLIRVRDCRIQPSATNGDDTIDVEFPTRPSRSDATIERENQRIRQRIQQIQQQRDSKDPARDVGLIRFVQQRRRRF